MHNVTVIFTKHDAIGNCNSVELLKIIESIQPEVVFEELLQSVYDYIYIHKSRRTLESDAIKMYLRKNKIQHIPMDTFEPPRHYYDSKNYLWLKIGEHISKSPKLQDAFNQLVSLTHEGGFGFLNSDQNDLIHDVRSAGENEVLSILGNERLHQIAELHREVVSKREDEIISNIYNYSRQNEYERAILFVGSAHRKSVMKKIGKIGMREGIDISWSFLSI